MPSGQHLVDGTWIAGTATFQAGNPATGELLAPAFAEADAAVVGHAVSAAEAAFADYAARPIAERAAFLRSHCRRNGGGRCGDRRAGTGGKRLAGGAADR